jgi:AcrR family transcriptional regulator
MPDRTSNIAASEGLTRAERPRRTLKYLQRQADIVRAATRLINEKGVRGMTLADVAAHLGIVPTGVIYYFASKEDLAAACFLKTISVYEALIAQAARAEAGERIGCFVRGYFELTQRIARGEHDDLTFFNDVRALNDPAVNAAFTAMFLNVRALFGEPPPSRSRRRRALNAVTHLLLSQLFWSVVWRPLYDAADYPRMAEKVLDILQHGIKPPSRPWSAPALSIPLGESWTDDVSRETFLRAATQLINAEGYRGASVDKISARLNVTKGSFYHHNEDKDDLVAACFRRTVEFMQRALRAATDLDEDGGRRLASLSVWLVEHQILGDAPLLRTSALTSAPASIRAEILAAFNRVSLGVSSLVSDGIADGSLRPIDANIAAQMITAMINAAAELPFWAPGQSAAEATRSYVRGLAQGLGVWSEEPAEA